MLQVSDVTIEYRTGERSVLATHKVSFDVHRGDRFVMLGPSGCGKSTLLKAIAGFIAPREGSIRLDGEELTRRGRFSSAPPAESRCVARRAGSSAGLWSPRPR